MIHRLSIACASAFMILAAFGYSDGDEGRGGKKMQDRPDRQDQQQKAENGKELKTGLVSANRLIGQSVKDSKGDLLGEVSDILIDRKKNRAAYVEVTFGGLLGMGAAERAVPFNALKATDEGLSLDISSERLNDLPRRSPGMSEEDFGRRIHTFFGMTPYWEKSNSGKGSEAKKRARK